MGQVSYMVWSLSSSFINAIVLVNGTHIVVYINGSCTVTIRHLYMQFTIPIYCIYLCISQVKDQ